MLHNGILSSLISPTKGGLEFFFDGFIKPISEGRILAEELLSLRRQPGVPSVLSSHLGFHKFEPRTLFNLLDHPPGVPIRHPLLFCGLLDRSKLINHFQEAHFPIPCQDLAILFQPAFEFNFHGLPLKSFRYAPINRTIIGCQEKNKTQKFLCLTGNLVSSNICFNPI